MTTEEQLTKRREYTRNWQKENKDKIKRYHHKYYVTHKAAIQAQQKEYREKNLEKIKKTMQDYLDNMTPEQREARKAYQHNYYLKNRDKILAQAKERNLRKKGVSA